jgi:hypothetical protein
MEKVRRDVIGGPIYSGTNEAQRIRITSRSRAGPDPSAPIRASSGHVCHRAALGTFRVSAETSTNKKAPQCGTSKARPERFELPTFGSVDRRSIQLSYGRLRAILAP